MLEMGWLDLTQINLVEVFDIIVYELNWDS